LSNESPTCILVLGTGNTDESCFNFLQLFEGLLAKPLVDTLLEDSG
jgi:hypothetical protein